MAMVAAPTKSEAQWQAEDDARTLASAEEIKRDPRRMARAVAAAKQLAVKVQKQADAHRSVAAMKSRSTGGRTKGGKR